MLSVGKVPPELVGTWIVMGLLIVFALLARRALAVAPDPMLPDEGFSIRGIAELIVDQIDSFVHGVMDTHGYRDLVPYLGCLFLFILAGNFFGLIPGMEPPTGSFNITFGLGIISFVYFIYHGLKAQGLGYLRHELGPILVLAPLMLPINLADNLFRPVSLGIRLYANMFADHTVLSIFTGLTKIGVSIAFYALGAIVCVIQALIFVVLNMSYVKLAQGSGHD